MKSLGVIQDFVLTEFVLTRFHPLTNFTSEYDLFMRIETEVIHPRG